MPFVRQLIGRQAGQIVEMPFHVMQACLATGTAAAVTEDEMREAGIAPPRVSDVEPDTFPDGYAAVPDEGGAGFNVTGPDGALIREMPFRNLAEARAAAVEHAGAAPAEAEPVEPTRRRRG